jgi:hypothetical protein
VSASHTCPQVSKGGVKLKFDLATIDREGFELEDAEALVPESIPPREVRADLWPGDLVKCAFHYGPGTFTERMWVKVAERVGDRYVGALDNHPMCTDRLEAGSRIVFGPENVTAILAEEVGNA